VPVMPAPRMSVAASTIRLVNEFSEDPQTLYQSWKGRWPFRQWLYIGITNSPSRRFCEHRARSDWMLEAGTIRLTRYPDRESVMEAERHMIRSKRPCYNVQHNRHQIEVELSPETMAAMGAGICLAILALRWLADVTSEWWVKRQAGRQGVSVELPPRRHPFTEPSVTLTMFEVFCCTMIGSGAHLRQPPRVAPVFQMPVPPPSAGTPDPGVSRLPAPPVGLSRPVGVLPAAIIATVWIMFALGAGPQSGPDRANRSDQEPGLTHLPSN
jgi:hypothetical protein